MNFEMSTIARLSSPTSDKLEAETVNRAILCSKGLAIERQGLAGTVDVGDRLGLVRVL